MTPRQFHFLLLLWPTLVPTAWAETSSEPARVDVFVTRTMPVAGAERLQQQLPDSAIRVHTIDGIEHITTTLEQNLPGDAHAAQRAALKRLQQFGKREREILQHAADALVLAWRYQLQRYPAVVFDRHWIIYGVTDLEIAYRLYQQRRGEGGT